MLNLEPLASTIRLRGADPAWVDAGFTAGWIPAFRHRGSGEVHASHLEDGRLACTHILDTLPACWIAGHDSGGRPETLIPEIQAGYLRGPRFFTLAELLSYPPDA